MGPAKITLDLEFPALAVVSVDASSVNMTPLRPRDEGVFTRAVWMGPNLDTTMVPVEPDGVTS